MRRSGWRERLAAMAPAVRLHPPAAPQALAAAERELGMALPAELRALLAECDGVTDGYGAGVIWPAASIAERNRELRDNPDLRTLYMPFDALLFIGDVGNGDRFFYRVLAGETRDPDIYVWDHETDSRVWRAASLEALLSSVAAAHG